MKVKQLKQTWNQWRGVPFRSNVPTVNVIHAGKQDIGVKDLDQSKFCTSNVFAGICFNQLFDSHNIVSNSMKLISNETMKLISNMNDMGKEIVLHPLAAFSLKSHNLW